jgi:hypothetical protein
MLRMILFSFIKHLQQLYSHFTNFPPNSQGPALVYAAFQKKAAQIVPTLSLGEIFTAARFGQDSSEIVPRAP